jgi:malate dehydrogenase
MLDGEHGIDGVVLGVMAHLGSTGLVAVDEIMLTNAETQSLHAAAEAIRTRLGL